MKKPGYVERMEKEQEELLEKIQKLDKWLAKNGDDLDMEEWGLMRRQGEAMKEYADLLEKRLVLNMKKLGLANE